MAFDALVVALGNPGPKYFKTRHNAGFILADLIVHDAGKKFELKKNLEAEVAELSLVNKKILIIKPQTYMNLSGRSLVLAYQKNKELKEIPLIVLHDEADLGLGRIRVKKGGSDAGHNGLKSIRECIGNGESFRIRLGVGCPVRGTQDVADYLLANFTREEENSLIDMLVKASRVLEALLSEGLEKAQSVAGEK